jgi:glycosyltransferase involved in cell wall biosynthesis
MLFSGVYELWEDPLILSCQGSPELRTALNFRRPKHILFSPTWLWTLKNLPELFRFRWQAAQSGKSLHLMDNAVQSNRMLRALGFPGDLANINLYVNEHIFTIRPQAKTHDAVYAAQMAPYKRLHLAAKIPRLFVQTYGEVKTAEGKYDLARFEPSVSHADHNLGWVTTDEVVDTYNRASVGLSLSACEGAMLASVEYMLCGIPQVSTPCKGGREQFFDPRYVIVADPNPEAIAAAVAELAARKVDPWLIREETLKKQHVHRQRLCDYVARLVSHDTGRRLDPAAVSERLFGSADGMSKWFVHFKKCAERGIV